MADLDRECKRCSNPLGKGVSTCPKCGQLNPTGEYAIAFTLVAVTISLLVIWLVMRSY